MKKYVCTAGARNRVQIVGLRLQNPGNSRLCQGYRRLSLNEYGLEPGRIKCCIGFALAHISGTSGLSRRRNNFPGSQARWGITLMPQGHQGNGAQNISHGLGFWVNSAMMRCCRSGTRYSGFVRLSGCTCRRLLLVSGRFHRQRKYFRYCGCRCNMSRHLEKSQRVCIPHGRRTRCFRLPGRC
jgi:hypothetical protein